MIKKKTVCICDICGKTVDAVARPWQYNETEYFPPEGWEKGNANNDVDICPDCMKIIRQSGISRICEKAAHKLP